MPEATNQQMQVFCDQRIRPFAEAWELLIARARAHKLAIDDVYARATTNPPVAGQWTDGRTDGPPHLMQSGYTAQDVPSSPDDVLAFNTMISALIALADGENLSGGDAPNQAEKAAVYDAIQGNLATLSRGVVRVIGS